MIESDKIKNENKESSPLTDYFKEVIYGGIDGIVTTFAVVAGFSGAMLSTSDTTQLTFVVVLLFGLANLFADATSMGLGNFLSVRSEKDLYTSARKSEEQTIVNNQTESRELTIRLMEEKGFSTTDAETLVGIYQKNSEYWLDFIMNHKLEMPDIRGVNPALTGLATFVSFLFFGAIPLLPFFFMETESADLAFYLSIAGTFLSLVILGILKWKVTKINLITALVEVLLVGGTAALVAYYVGSLFAG